MAISVTCGRVTLYPTKARSPSRTIRLWLLANSVSPFWTRKRYRPGAMSISRLNRIALVELVSGLTSL